MQTENDVHYLKTELDALFASDPEVSRFIQLGTFDGVWFWDLETEVDEWMSPEFWELFGVDPATKKHSPDEWQDMIFPDDLAVALRNFRKHCEDPRHPYDQIVRYWHADGSTVWVRCRGIAIRDASGRPIRMLGAHSDMTRVMRLEQIARARQSAAEAANAELRTFAYSVSHDLKAPANTLHLLLTELGHELSDQMNDDARHLFDLCIQTTERMQTLVESVLRYTSIVDAEPIFARVSLDAEVANALSNLDAMITEKGAKITVEPLPDVDAIGNQMGVLFQNLIENAIKYARPGVTPEVSVTLNPETDSETVVIDVADNGIGVPPESRDRIFAMFQRLHSHDQIEGFGLGLSLCQRVAVTHGGGVEFGDHEGEGSTFTVTLAKRHLP